MKTLRESILDPNFDIEDPAINFPNGEQLIDIFLKPDWKDWRRPQDKGEKDYYSLCLHDKAAAHKLLVKFEDFLRDLYFDLPKDAVRDTYVLFKKTEIQLVQPVGNRNARSLVLYRRSRADEYIFVNAQTTFQLYNYRGNFKIPHEVLDAIIWCLDKKV